MCGCMDACEDFLEVNDVHVANATFTWQSVAIRCEVQKTHDDSGLCGMHAYYSEQHGQSQTICSNPGDKVWKRNMNIGPVRLRNVGHAIVGQKSANKARSKKKKRWIGIGRKIVESHFYEIAIIVITFIALFMEDVETLILTSTFRNTDQYGKRQGNHVLP